MVHIPMKMFWFISQTLHPGSPLIRIIQIAFASFDALTRKLYTIILLLRTMNIKAIAPMAIPYHSYRYLYPPRPDREITPDKLHIYDNGGYMAQPKLNGSNTLLFMNDDGTVMKMDSHNEEKTGKFDIDFAKLYRGKGWYVLNGEWMEKSKHNHAGENFNGNFIIFDILVYNGLILAGSNPVDRVHLLHDLYGSSSMKVTGNKLIVAEPYLYFTDIDHVYRVISYAGKFEALYNMMVKIDMQEGLVLKSRDAFLSPPFKQLANSRWSFKCRKLHIP